MGSRAIVVVCRNQAAAARRFTDDRPAHGVIHTRTGRPSSRTVLTRQPFSNAFACRNRSRIVDELETDWLALDCELLPWSAKAEDLLRGQYAAVGAAATTTLAAERSVLAATAVGAST